MQEDLIERMRSFIMSIAKTCDTCPMANSSSCNACVGSEAKRLRRDIEFKPWVSSPDMNELTMTEKLTPDFRKVSWVAHDCNMTWGIAIRCANRLTQAGIAEMKGLWIRMAKQK